MKPTIGRIVHYYPSEYDNPEQWNRGEVGQPIAAVIVRVWSDECVNLRLLTDCDYTPWKTSVVFNEECKEASWSWPPRVG